MYHATTVLHEHGYMLCHLLATTSAHRCLCCFPCGFLSLRGGKAEDNAQPDPSFMYYVSDHVSQAMIRETHMV